MRTRGFRCHPVSISMMVNVQNGNRLSSFENRDAVSWA
ncbi:hypothetical protein RISK_006431 [Rhodopirellula islandica]|uniref:Uncharacterized protein n=1 Tax=Rhodopirellula islandica TaxID=595434 RepID=A0A0J1E7Z0_RHOIS|nr:hypothetical protein RISK_006431 [Rhodopirellula islandica]